MHKFKLTLISMLIALSFGKAGFTAEPKFKDANLKKEGFVFGEDLDHIVDLDVLKQHISKIATRKEYLTAPNFKDASGEKMFLNFSPDNTEILKSDTEDEKVKSEIIKLTTNIISRIRSNGYCLRDGTIHVYLINQYCFLYDSVLDYFNRAKKPWETTTCTSSMISWHQDGKIDKYGFIFFGVVSQQGLSENFLAIKKFNEEKFSNASKYSGIDFFPTEERAIGANFLPSKEGNYYFIDQSERPCGGRVLHSLTSYEMIVHKDKTKNKAERYVILMLIDTAKSSVKDKF